MALRIATLLVVALAVGASLLWFQSPAAQEDDSASIGRRIDLQENEAVEASSESAVRTLPPIATETFVSETMGGQPQLHLQAVDSEGHPLPHLTLELELRDAENPRGSWSWGQEPPPDPLLRGLTGSRTTTDAEGRFTIPDQGRARFHLVAHGEERSGSVNLARGEAAARLVMHEVAKIIVTVLDQDDRPLPHIEVTVVCDEPATEPSDPSFGHTKSHAWTREPDGEAHFRFRAPVRGSKEVGFTVHAATESSGKAGAFYSDSEHHLFAPSDVTQVMVRGKAGINLEVEVLSDGKPVSDGWRLLGFGPESWRSRFTGEERSRIFRGAKVMIGGLTPGELIQIQLAEASYPPVRRLVRLPRQSGRHAVQLERPQAGAEISLLITDESGNAVATEEFSFAWRPSGAAQPDTNERLNELERHCETDSEGRASMLVPSGVEGVIQIPRAPFDTPLGVIPPLPDQRPLPALEAGSTTELSVTLPTAKTVVSGRIRPADPTLLEGLWLSLTPIDPPEDRGWQYTIKTTPEDDGSFRFTSLEPLPPDFEMELSARGEAVGSIARRVRVGETGLVLGLTPLGQFACSFRGPSAVLEEVRVGMWPSQPEPTSSPWPQDLGGAGPFFGEHRWKGLSNQGRATFTILPEGLYDVHVVVNLQEILCVPRVRVDHRHPSTDGRLLDRDLGESVGVTRLRIIDEAGAPIPEATVRLAPRRSPNSFSLVHADAEGVATLRHAASGCPPVFVYSNAHRSVSLQPTAAQQKVVLKQCAPLELRITAPVPLPTDAVYDRWSVYLEALRPLPYPFSNDHAALIDLPSGTARFPHLETGRYRAFLEPTTSQVLERVSMGFTILWDPEAGHRLGEVTIGTDDEEKKVSFSVSSNQIRALLRGGF